VARRQVILVNGPPRSGKDTVGEILRRRHGCLVTKFAKQLKEMAHGLHSIVGGDAKPVRHDYFEKRKDDSCDEFMGATPRQCYIALSENYLKPLYGEDVMGEMLLKSLLGGAQWRTAVVTDSGFSDEAMVLLRHFGVDSIALIRLHRVDCCFSNDSRGYIHLPGVRSFDIANNGQLSDLAVEVAKVADTIGVVYEGAESTTERAAEEDSSGSE